MSGRRIGPAKPQLEITKRVTSKDREIRVNNDPDFTNLVGESKIIARIAGSPNKSNGKTPVHTVSATLNRDGSITPTCTCQSFRIQKNKCKHLDLVRDEMAEELTYRLKNRSKHAPEIDILDVFLDWMNGPKER